MVIYHIATVMTHSPSLHTHGGFFVPSEPRRFSPRQRRAIYHVAEGRCQICGVQLDEHWHADHIVPWSLGGATNVWNAQALCPHCNITKGNTYVKAQEPS